LEALLPQAVVLEVEEVRARSELVVRVPAQTSMVREERATRRTSKPAPLTSLFLEIEVETETTPVLGLVVVVVEPDPQERLVAMELAEQVDLVMHPTSPAQRFV
jgi:tRNA(Ser,Leu) C12 N-acetylase TAN1